MGPRRREALEGYLFLTPWAIGFVIFIGGPMLASLYLSFTKYNVMLAPEWVGLGNYITALTRDALFIPSILRTFYYTALVVPLGLALSAANYNTARALCNFDVRPWLTLSADAQVILRLDSFQPQESEQI